MEPGETGGSFAGSPGAAGTRKGSLAPPARRWLSAAATAAGWWWVSSRAGAHATAAAFCGPPCLPSRWSPPRLPLGSSPGGFFSQGDAVDRFCLELGCTPEEYERTREELLSRKVRLSRERLAVEDEIDRLETAGWGGATPGLPERGGELLSGTLRETLRETLGSAVSSLWSGFAAAGARIGHQKGAGGQTRILSWTTHGLAGTGLPPIAEGDDEGPEPIEFLRELRKELSERALAIQNLLANLEWVEDGPGGGVPGSTSDKAGGTTLPTAQKISDIVDRYRGVLDAEGISLAVTLDGFGGYDDGDGYDDDNDDDGEEYGADGAPHPPDLPPTPLQFMKQCVSELGTAASTGEDEVDDRSEEWDERVDPDTTGALNWFGRDRIDANPFNL